MQIRSLVLSVAVVAAICGPAAGQIVLPPKIARDITPQTKSTRLGPAACDELWLSRIALDELQRCASGADGSNYSSLAERMEKAMLARLACGGADRLSVLNDLVYVKRACEYLPTVEQLPDGKKFAGWLVKNRKISRLMFRALGEVQDPAESLKKLQELVKAAKKTVLDYPNLSVAFATARPLRHYRKQPDPCTMLESFTWYTNPKIPFRYDLRNMPYELSRYLADTRLRLAERRWAMKKYSRKRNLGRCYFDLKYDWDHYKKGKPKKIAKLEYTLANLHKVGGVCIDQAYYAAEVCKAFGVPAAISVGRGRSGMGHAWLARLKIDRKNRRGVWDTRTGRYRLFKYYFGKVRDPGSGSRIFDSQLSIGGMASQLPLRRLEEADAATALAMLVEQFKDDQAAVDLSVLKDLAKLHDERFATDEQQKTAGAETGWIQQAGKVDQALMEDMIGLAISRNLAHTRAWQYIIQLRSSEQLPVKSLNRFFDVLVTRTAKEYPDYSCLMVMQIVPTIPDAAIRLKVYQRSLGVYGKRPDLRGRILLAVGDDYRDQDKLDMALKAYAQAAEVTAEVPAVVMRASSQAEQILAARGEIEQAIRMYTRLMELTKRFASTSAFRSQTSYYRIGKRLAALLKDAGREKQAESILKKIEES